MAGVGGLSERLAFIIDANVDSAIAGFKRVGDSAEKDLGKTQDHLDKLGGKLQTAGVGMMAFGGTALVALGNVAKAGEDAHQVDLKLENSVMNAGAAAGGSVQPFMDLASAMQNKTEFDDEAVKSGESLLIQFGLTKDQVLTLTPLVADLAAKMGVDLETASKAVGKAVEGNVGGLQRMGIFVDKTAFQSDHFGAVMDALSSKVGGFAEQQGASFEGRLEITKNKLHDLEEGVGVGVVNAFDDMFGAVDAVSGALESLSPDAQSTIGEIATFGAVGLVAVGAFNLLAGTAIKFRENLAQLLPVRAADAAGAEGEAAANMKLQASLVPVAGLVLAVGAAFMIGKSHAEEFHLNIEKIANASAPDLDAGMAKILQGAQLTGTSLYDVGQQIAQTSIPAAERFADSLDRTGHSSADVRRAIDDQVNSLKQQQSDQQATTDAVDGSTQAEISYTDAIKGVSDALKAQFDPLFGMLDAVQQNRDAQTKATGAAMEAASAHQQYGDASLQAMDADQKLADANTNVAKTALGVQDAAGKLAAGVADGSVSVADATTTLNGWVAQGLITQDQANQVAWSFGGVTTQADGIIARSNIGMMVTADTTQAQQQLIAVLNLQARIDAGTFGNSIGGSIAHNGAGGNAGGTDWWGGGLSWVGENGAELLALPRGSAVVNNTNARALASAVATGGGGGGGDTHVHFHIDTLIGEKRAVIAVLEEAAREGVQFGPSTKRQIANAANS